MPSSATQALAVGPDEELRTWLGTLTGQAEAFPDLSGLRVGWRVTSLAALSDAEAEALRKAVAGRPDHPDRQRLEREDRARGGRGWMERELWMRGADEYRLGSSAPDARGELQVVDDVRRDDLSWTLVGTRALTVRAPDRADPDDRNLRVISRAARNELLSLLSGGLAQVGAKRGELVTARTQGDGWEARWNLENGARVVASGVWSAGVEARTVQRVRFDWSGESGPVWFEFLSGPWQTVPGIGLRVAAWVEERESQKLSDRRIEFTEVVKERRASFDELTRPPTAQGMDPVRGPVALVTITDRTGDEAIFRRYFPDGSVRDVRASDTVQAQSRSDLRWLGWVILGVLGSAIIIVRVSRWRHA